MNIHHNARTTLHGRMLMIERLAGGWIKARVAAAFGVDPRTVHKWLTRYRQGDYNTNRPHSALGGKPPISRITRNNLLGNDT